MKTNQTLLNVGIIIIAFVFLSFRGFSQTEINVEQVRMTMSQGEQTGFKIVIPLATFEDAKNAWISQVQKDFKVKVLMSDTEINFEGAYAGEMSYDPINIYSILTETNSTLNLFAFFEIDNVFFDTATYADGLVKDKIFYEIRNYLHRFAVKQYKNAVEKELSAEDGKLDELEKQLSGMNKANRKVQKSVTRLENNLADINDEIKFLDDLRTAQMEQIEAKRVAPVPLTDKEAHEKGYAELDQMEKEKAKTDKSIEKLEKRRSATQEKMENCKKDIEEKTGDQETLNSQISQQEQIVKEIKSKLHEIK